MHRSYPLPHFDLRELEPTLRRHCLDLYGSRLAAAFVVGSYASGTHRNDSDLDLLLILDSSDKSRPHRAREFDEPPDYRGPPLSPVVLTKAEFLSVPPFVLSLLEAHHVLYSRDRAGEVRSEDAHLTDEATSLLHAVRRYASDHGITRIPHKGGAYWRGLPTR